jgi:hypothetical protein
MNCGSELPGAKGGQAPAVPATAHGPERAVEDLGRRIETGLRKLGESVEREITQEKHRLIKSWDRKFGLLAPVVSGAMGCVALLVALVVMDSLATSGDNGRLWDRLGEFVVEYILLFIALIFLSSFQNYFNRNHRDKFRWISPILTAAAFAAWFWVFSQILLITGRELQDEAVRDLARFFELLVPVVFVLALGIGYAVQLMLRALRRSLPSGRK